MTTRKRGTRERVTVTKADVGVLKIGKVPHNPDVQVKPLRTRKEMESHIRALSLRCKGPRDAKLMEKWQGLMNEGKEEEARAVETRPGCGYDVGEIVLSNPLDGKEYDYVCPKCGNAGSYRAPLFTELAGK